MIRRFRSARSSAQPLVRALRALALVALCLPATAAAQEARRRPADELAAKPSPAVIAEAQRRFARGNRLYKQGDYREALLAYQAARDLYPEPTILYNIAQTYEKLRDPAEAAIHFERFLRARPKSPDRAAVEARIARLRAEARVDVSVTSYPPGAAIRLATDPRGTVRGRTPFSIKLPLGKQRIRVELGGFVPAERSLEVRLGDPNPVDFQLERRSSIRVDADVPGAIVALRAGRGLAERHRAPHLFEVDPGRHRIEVELAGFHGVVRELEVRPGEQLSLLVNMRALPRYGRFLVEGAPGASVLVDGKLLASLPMPPAKLATGSYRVLVERDGHRSWEGKVTVAENRLTVARVQLSTTRGVVAKSVVYGSAGLAAGSLIAGAVLGALALRAERDYNTLPERGKLDDGKGKALASDICFAAAGAAALSAIITYFATERGASTADLDVAERARAESAR